MSKLTHEQFAQSLDIIRIMCECVFQKEDSFKKNVIEKNVRLTEPYEIHNVYFSGYLCKVTIRYREDYSEKDIVLDTEDFYSWYEDEVSKL